MADLEKLERQTETDELEAYSQTVVDHAMNPRNLGTVGGANGFAKVTGTCGDTMAIWLNVKGDKIDDITFLTNGCAPSIACGSMVTEIAKGKSLSEARRINQRAILEALGGLPEDHEHCALFAVNTLKQAIRDYMAFTKDPWKRAYRR